MVELRELLQARREAVFERWLANALGEYPKDASAFFRREKDQFANPVGQTLRSGMRAILEGLLSGDEADSIRSALVDIIKIRAVQDLSPSQAVSFVLQLKRAIRAELGNNIRELENSDELAKLEEKVDRLALFAFDIYVGCRERVYEIRVNEAKRSVSALLRKRFGQGDREKESNPGPSEEGTSLEDDVR